MLLQLIIPDEQQRYKANCVGNIRFKVQKLKETNVPRKHTYTSTMSYKQSVMEPLFIETNIQYDPFSSSQMALLEALSMSDCNNVICKTEKKIQEQTNLNDLYSFIDSFDFMNTNLATTLTETGEFEELLNELLELDDIQDSMTYPQLYFSENNFQLIQTKCTQAAEDQYVSTPCNNIFQNDSDCMLGQQSYSSST